MTINLSQSSNTYKHNENQKIHDTLAEFLRAVLSMQFNLLLTIFVQKHLKGTSNRKSPRTMSFHFLRMQLLKINVLIYTH